MKTRYILIGALTFGFFYIIAVNLIANSVSTFQGNEKNNSPTFSYGSNIQIGVADNVDVAIVRHRWYGTIYESENKSFLRLFGFIKLPVEINGFPYWMFHFIVLVIATLISIVIGLEQFLNPRKPTERRNEIQCIGD